MRLVGRDMTVEEVMKETSKDRMFNDESRGGVTFSGGEPLSQPDFLMKLLEKCKTQDIQTALDTSGLANRKTIEKMLNLVDLWLYDLKHMDSREYERVIGILNEMILCNLQ